MPKKKFYRKILSNRHLHSLGSRPISFRQQGRQGFTLSLTLMVLRASEHFKTSSNNSIYLPHLSFSISSSAHRRALNGASCNIPVPMSRNTPPTSPSGLVPTDCRRQTSPQIALSQIRNYPAESTAVFQEPKLFIVMVILLKFECRPIYILFFLNKTFTKLVER